MNKKTFTLIELILILTTFAFLSLLPLLQQNFREEFRVSEQINQQKLAEIRQSILDFFYDTGRLPNNLNELITNPGVPYSFSESKIHNPFILRMTNIAQGEWKGPYLNYLERFDKKEGTNKNTYTDGYKNTNTGTIFRNTLTNKYFFTSTGTNEQELTISPDNFSFFYQIENAGSFEGNDKRQNINSLTQRIYIESLQKIGHINNDNEKNIEKRSLVELSTQDLYIRCNPWNFQIILQNDSFEDQRFENLRVGLFFRGISQSNIDSYRAPPRTDDLSIPWAKIHSNTIINDNNQENSNFHQLNFLADVPLYHLNNTGINNDNNPNTFILPHGHRIKFNVSFGSKEFPKYIPKTNLVILLYNDHIEGNLHSNKQIIRENFELSGTATAEYTLNNPFNNPNTIIESGLANRFVQKIPITKIRPQSFIDLPKKIVVKIPPPIIQPSPQDDLSNFGITYNISSATPRYVGAPAVLRRDVTENLLAFDVLENPANLNILYSITRITAFSDPDINSDYSLSFEGYLKGISLPPNIFESADSSSFTSTSSIVRLRESFTDQNPKIENLSQGITTNDRNIPFSIPVLQTAGNQDIDTATINDLNYNVLYTINRHPIRNTTNLNSQELTQGVGFIKILSPNQAILKQGEEITFTFNHPLNTTYFLFHDNFPSVTETSYNPTLSVKEYKINDELSLTNNYNSSGAPFTPQVSFISQQLVKQANYDPTTGIETLTAANNITPLTPTNPSNNTINFTVGTDTRRLEVWANISFPAKNQLGTGGTNSNYTLAYLLKVYYVE